MRPHIVQTSASPEMTPQAVLEIIDQARRQEARSGAFLRQMKEKAARLPGSVVVDGYQPATSLFQFAVEYIEMAPRLVECVDACAREAGITELFQPFIDAATRYFTQPSVLLVRYDGLDGLLIRAYLCHRLMEEMHDNNRSTRASELIDLEATRANLLVHELIGEPFANELDDAITVTVLQIAGTPDYYDLDLEPFIDQVNNQAWDWMRQYWENLLERNHIRFALGPSC
ncbi:hypothetical protein DET61_108111 [Marinobacter nauticus]|uniref:Uncharacterized protein n=3 Tax=Marinobacter nauticus TaxID=2743 RepID=A0A368XP16_MARNT|nr:conserved hypothetical protein [Marinobacter nauticus VT8]KAE8547317.1 hypothetical protein F6453_0209 [Marinobacter nauticus]MCC4271675.1 hypothetical protein [Marinobacter nauticus]RCW67754.1 hypothetical protein DET61_108111 [Marinobacter nauticus]RKR72195.1 hypothetical protein C7436_2555 [Marinobacter nauticus]